jgi:hypothetical protein
MLLSLKQLKKLLRLRQKLRLLLNKYSLRQLK